MPKKLRAAMRLAGPYLIMAVVFAAVAAMLVSCGMRNADEGFYALASKLVYAGQVPYRDFAYTQTPLFPYMQGAAMELVGFGVREQRWLNVLWDAGALGLIAWRFRRAGVSTAATCVLLGLWVCSLPLFYFCVIGKTYALVQLLLIVAAMGLWDENPRRAAFWVAVCGVLATACRLTVGPVVALLYLGVAIRAARQGVSRVYLVLLPALLGAAALGPFILAAPENAYFWIWEYHTLSAMTRLPWTTLALHTVTFAPAVLVLFVFAALRMRGAADRFSPWACCAAAGALGAVVAIVVPRVYAEYSAPCWSLILLGSGGLLAGEGALSGRGRRLAAAVAAGLYLVSFGASVHFAQGNYSPHYLDAVDEVAAFLRTRTSQEAMILTAAPEVLLHTGRKHHPALALGHFAVTGEMTPDLARRRRVMHFTELVSTIEAGSAEALVFRDRDNSNFERSIPSLRFFDQRNMDQIAAAILRRYRLAYANNEFQVFIRDTER